MVPVSVRIDIQDIEKTEENVFAALPLSTVVTTILTIPEDIIMKNSSGIIICPMNGDDGAVMISGDKSRFCY